MPDEIKLFDKWDTSEVVVKDEGLKKYITLRSVIVPRSEGRHERKQFHKSQINIVERLMNKLFVAGHRGKKHKFSSGKNVGQTATVYKIARNAFENIEKATGKNPVQIFVRALENSAPIEEVMTYQKGGIFAREAVVTSPQRRIDLALKHIAQGSYQKSTRSKIKASDSLANEIVAAYNKDCSKSLAISEKERREKEAVGAR